MSPGVLLGPYILKEKYKITLGIYKYSLLDYLIAAELVHSKHFVHVIITGPL